MAVVFPRKEVASSESWRSPRSNPTQIILTQAVLRAADSSTSRPAMLRAYPRRKQATVSRIEKRRTTISRPTQNLRTRRYVRPIATGSLDAIVGSDEATARASLANGSLALDATAPAERVPHRRRSRRNVIAYSDTPQSLSPEPPTSALERHRRRLRLTPNTPFQRESSIESFAEQETWRASSTQPEPSLPTI